MKPLTSLYLDAVRFTAAMTVFLGHMSGARDPRFITPAAAQWLAGFATCQDEAVVIFFVLSGFVISHATRNRPPTPGSYAVARLSRLHSVALPALATTLLLDTVGRYIQPEVYQPFQLLNFLTAPLFLNEFWYGGNPPGSNGPYWSLNYEAWYYVLFGLLIFLRGWRRVLAVVPVLVLCGPQMSLYFLLWLAGVWLHRLTQRGEVARPLARPLAWALCLGGAVIFGVAAFHGVPGETQVLAALAWAIRDSNISHDAVIALGFGMNLLGVNALAGAGLGRLASAVEAPVRWLAGATFTIYLFHMPLSRFLLVWLPTPPAAWAPLVLVGLGFGLMLGIAALTERRKRAWQRGFGAALATCQGWLRARSLLRTP